jgi:hypothetical protein
VDKNPPPAFPGFSPFLSKMVEKETTQIIQPQRGDIIEILSMVIQEE